MAWSRPTGAMNVSFAGGATIAQSVSPGTVGRLIVVTSGHDSVTATMTIADTAGNTWLQACPRRTQAGGGSLQVWYAIANGTGSTTITVTDSVSTGFRNILIDVFDGNGSGTPLDNHTETSAGSGSPTTTITPVVNNCLLYAAANDSVTAVGSGFTVGSDDGASDWSEYKALTGGAGGSQTANFTGSGAWILCVATFAPAGAGTFIAEKQPPVLQAVNRAGTY